MDIDPFREAFERIDRVIFRGGERPSKRPLDLAVFFTTHCIVSLKDSSGIDIYDEHLFEKPVFGYFYAAAKQYYIELYGKDAVELNDADIVPCPVEIERSFFVLNVPTVRTYSGGKDLKVIHFPDRVVRGENSLSWLSPAFAISDASRKTKSRRKCNQIGTWRRQALTACRMVQKTDESTAYFDSVDNHLDSAARYIAEQGDTSLAVWELNLAVEKTFKGGIVNLGGIPRRVHDLRILNDQLSKMSHAHLSPRYIEIFPSGEMAVKYRYGEAKSPDRKYAYELFLKTLKQVKMICDLTPGSIHISSPGIKITLKKPVWADVAIETLGF